MLLLLDLVLTIVSAICALFLLLLGILLVLDRLPFRLSRQNVKRLGQLFSTSPQRARDLSTRSTLRPQPVLPLVLENDLPKATSVLPPTLPPQSVISLVPRQKIGSSGRLPRRPTPLPQPSNLSLPSNRTLLTGGIALPETPPDFNGTARSGSLAHEQRLIQLLRLLQDNVDRRDRLIQHAKQRYPGQSDIWYLEKLIEDLDGNRNRQSGRGTPT